MKKHITFILVAFLGLCGCSQTDNPFWDWFSIFEQGVTDGLEGNTDTTVNGSAVDSLANVLKDLGSPVYRIYVSPERFTVDKNGETFVIRASVPDTCKNGDPYPLTLTNEVFFDAWDHYYSPANLPDLHLKNRLQIDDRNVEYTFSIDKNPSKSERKVGYLIVDTTTVFWPSISELGYFIITQPGE